MHYQLNIENNVYGIHPTAKKKQETGANWNAKCFGCVFGTYNEQILVPERGWAIPKLRLKQNRRDSCENKSLRCLTVYECDFVHATEFHLYIPNSISVGYLKSIITSEKRLNIEKQTHTRFDININQNEK